MMLFELENNIPKFSPITLNIKEFRKIWSRDRTTDKKRANAELSFIFFMCDFKSLYRNYEDSEKIVRIKEDLVSGESIKEDDEDLIAAMDKYKELIKSPTLALLDDAESAILKVRRYFRDVDLTLTDNNDKPIYTAKDLIANIKSVGDLAESLRKTREQVEREQGEVGKIMGGEKKALFED